MRKRMTVGVLLTVLVMAFAPIPNMSDGNWPSWRGPDRTGVAAGAPPVEWSEEHNIAWKTELDGLGSATPVVWGDRVYVMTAYGEGEVSWALVAYDTANGSEVWRQVLRQQEPFAGKHATNSYASASAITDGEHIFAFFGSYGLYAMDMDGEVLWAKDFGRMYTRRDFGEGASPALHGDTLAVIWDQETESSIAALDKSTGEELWRVQRDEPTTWATPLIVEHGGTTQVITAGTNRSRSYDLATGELLWDGPGLTLNAIPSPVHADGIVYLTAGFRGSALQAVDLDKASGTIDETDALLWRIERDTPYVPSPLLADGIVYYVKSNSGILSAMRGATGELLYGPQRLDGIQEIYASPVAANGHIYILGRDGGGLVLRQGESYEVVALNTLDDGFDASPVIIGDAMYLRGRTALYKIQATGE